MKRLGVLFLFSISIFVLAACGEEQSSKEAFIEAYHNFDDAKRFEATIDLDYNVDGDGQMMGMINNAEVSFDLKSDLEKKKHQLGINATIPMAPMSIDINNINVLIDEQKKLSYLNTNKINKNLGMMLPQQLPSDKVLKLDLSNAGKLNNIGVLNEDIQKQYTKMVEQKAEEDFTRNEDGFISVQFSKNELKPFLKKAGLMNKEMTLKDISLVSKVKDGKLVSEKIEAQMTSTNPMTQKTVNMDMVVNINIDSINKSFEFDVNPTKDNVVDAKEVFNQMPLPTPLPGPTNGTTMPGPNEGPTTTP